MMIRFTYPWIFTTVAQFFFLVCEWAEHRTNEPSSALMIARYGYHEEVPTYTYLPVIS